MGVPAPEIADIIQDAYVAIARLDTVAHIRNPRAYFFTTARHALLQRVRRDRIVRIDTLSEAQALVLADDEPDPYRHTSARMELRRVQRLIDALPDRCREIFVARRIHAVPQREIAARMGLSEAVVEAQAIRGLRLIMQAIQDEDAAVTGAAPIRNGQDHDRNQR
jgi:RNA polymerase sigma-70 factor (ECF subfamily)